MNQAYNLDPELLRKAAEKANHYISTGYLNTAAAVASHLTMDNDPYSIAMQVTGGKSTKNMALDMAIAGSKVKGDVYTLARVLAEQYLIKQHKDSSQEEFEKAVKEAVEEAEAEKEMMLPGGHKGGESIRNFFQGYPLPFGAVDEVPEYIKQSGAMVFAKQQTNSKKVEGKPKSAVHFRRIRRLEEITRVIPKQLCVDDDVFELMLAQRQLIGKFPLRSKQELKTMVILLDDSGSMSVDTRVTKLTAILESLFKEVEKESLRLLIAPFEYSLGPAFELKNAHSVNEFKKIVTDGSGGDTYLNRILPNVITDLQKGMFGTFKVPVDTRILIINDGEDPPGEMKPAAPVHALSLGEFNKDLSALCKASGGDYTMYKSIT